MKGRQRGGTEAASRAPPRLLYGRARAERRVARYALLSLRAALTCVLITPDRKSEIGPARSRAQKSPVRCPPKRGFESTEAEVGGKGLPHGSQRSNFQERSLPNENPVLTRG